MVITYFKLSVQINTIIIVVVGIAGISKKLYFYKINNLFFVTVMGLVWPRGIFKIIRDKMSYPSNCRASK
jgi:hypothetical protein